jgi:3-oxoacyl-[acyl-carrier protein] reductase
MELQGASVVVTGGSSGIGRAITRSLTAAGAKVLITGRREEALRQVAEETGAQCLVADVASHLDVQRTFHAVHKHFGALDCLINNAGIGSFAPLVELDEEEFLRIWSVNVLGAAMMAKYAAQIFVKQKRGTILNIASTAATKGFANGTIYAASKFALRGMAECWREEVRRSNVRVININPSEVPTAFGREDRVERPDAPNKLTSEEIAHAVVSALTMDDRGFIPEIPVFATNPWG